MIVDFLGMGMDFGDGNCNENGDGDNQVERDGRLVGGGDNDLVGDDGNGSENRTIDYVDGGGGGNECGGGNS